MSLKFLHSSDWQMGMKALQAGEKAKEVRAKRFETATRVAELAKSEKVDFVVLAGDLFEDHNVDESVVRRTVAVLESFAPIPVFVLPGNHDPLVPGGIWERQSWQRIGAHVTLLKNAEEVQFRDDVVLYPAPLSQKQSTIDPTVSMPSRVAGDERIRIGIAHGSLDILAKPGNFPITPTRAEDAGLDYLALGDWHGFVQHGRAVYPGTLEQTSFDEKDPGNIVVVEITDTGVEPVVSKHQVGALRWTMHAPDIRDSTDVEQLRQEIMSGDQLSTQLLRIRPVLDLALPSDALNEIRSLRDELLEEAFLLDWPAETLDAVLDASVVIPEGLLTEIDDDLGAILEGRIPEGPAREGAAAEPAVAQEARALLRRIVAEVQR